MRDQDQYDEMIAAMQRKADEDMERKRRYIAHLRSMYGNDDWTRGAVLLFYPNPNEEDQEVRAAVKIGVGKWTISGRGSSRTWDEMLEKLGPRKIMLRVTGTEPHIVVVVEHDHQ